MPRSLAPTFKATVALVPMTAVVRDSRNRLVQDLRRDDFQVFENGRQRAIVDFNATAHGPVSVALLFDTSGSMRIGSNLENAKGVVEHLLSWLEPSRDEVGRYSRLTVRFAERPHLRPIATRFAGTPRSRTDGRHVAL